MALSEADLQSALRAVVDPNTGRDFVTGRQVRNLSIAGGSVSFEVELGYPARSQHAALRQLLGTGDPKGLLDETLSLLQTLIRNKCVNAGDGLCEEIVSIHTLRDFLAGYGLACEIHHPPDKPKRPSLLATYGSGEGPRVMLGPGHVDVVPANPEIWTQDPWAGKVVDGKVR